MIPPDEAPQSSPDRPIQQSSRISMSRRAKWVGVVITIFVIAGLAGLTWYSTRPASSLATPASGAGSAGGQSGPGGAAGPGGGSGGAGGGGRGASTVGVATAERASIPVTLDALGTVTPLATVKVRPRV